MKDTHRGLALFTALVFLFLLGPLLIIMATSFGDSSVLKFPPEGFSFRWYSNIFDVEMFMTTFKVTIVVALAGNLIALLIGVPPLMPSAASISGAKGCSIRFSSRPS